MNISKPSVMLQFGAVYKQKPKDEPTLYFQQDVDKAGMTDSYYATSEDKVVLQPLNDAINTLGKAYRQVKKDFLVKTGYPADLVSMAISASCNNIYQEENNVNRREFDDTLIRNFPKVEGHAAFVAARDAYEIAENQYLGKTLELARKAI